MATVDIVCTTIGDGSFLVPYAQEIVAAGAQDRVRMVVIPDRKTPLKLAEAVSALYEDITIECPDILEQESFLAKLGVQGMFPLDSDGRRNIGYLMAYEHGADIVISVDDDNLPQPGWLREHQQIAETVIENPVSSPNRFWNPLRLMTSEPAGIYPRGYPFSRRWAGLSAFETLPVKECEVSINAGLWLGDPDVDAIARLAGLGTSVRATPLTTAISGSRVLAEGTWAPVDSQNTAVRREVIPAYCYFESAKRFADIWQGYFAQACAQHLGHHVRFGTPAADCAVRNDHDLLNDLRLEYDGIMMLDPVLDWLTEVKLEGSTYAETYGSLRHELGEFYGADRDLNHQQTAILWDLTQRMGDWLKVIRRIG